MSEVLEGFEPMDMPTEAMRTSKYNWVELIPAFLETGNDCMGKRYTDKQHAMKAYGALRRYITAHDLPVKAGIRNNLLLLIRDDES